MVKVMMFKLVLKLLVWNDNNLRVYYDGKHTDFTDENDIIDTNTPGAWTMQTGDTTNGSTWASEVSTNTSAEEVLSS